MQHFIQIGDGEKMILEDKFWEQENNEKPKTVDDLFKEIRIHEDMLRGNIARIFMTDNIDELESMKKYAYYRINEIANIKTEIIESGDLHR